jgi:hypothetical protein
MAYTPQEPERIFEHNGEKYLRTGYCCRCGQCCVGNPFSEDDNEPEPVVENYCPIFRWLEEGVGHCSNREHPYYLRGCVDWPTHPGQITDKPGCTYEFTEIN